MEIPLFPLPNLVLFPNVVLPLHIFEERYKLMISEVVENQDAFGIVCLKHGATEEDERSIHRVGVTVRVVRVEQLADGRMNILCRGESRFRIFRFTGRIPYWKASVDFFDDQDSGVPSLHEKYEEVAALYRKAFKLGAELGSVDESDLAIPESPTDLSYMVGYVLDLESDDKQRLLEMTSTGERLRVLSHALAESIQKLEQQVAFKGMVHKVKGNGDLGKPGKM
jgi:Lon protease-like protein